MTLLIRCTGCQKQLKVPETLVGKKVKCPACGVVLTVAASTPASEMPAAEPPMPPPPAAPPAVVPPPLPAESPEEAIRERPVVPPPLPRPASPEDDDAPIPSRRVREDDDFAEPRRRRLDDDYDDEPRRRRPGDDYDDEDEFDVRRRRRSITRKPEVGGVLLPPAICLIVTGVLGVLVNVFQVIISIVDPDFLQQNNAFGQDTPPALSAVVGAVFTIFGILTVVGAIAMIKRRYYGLALTGTILAMIDIGNCCCILGLPFGIWALIILVRPDVKEAFDL